MVAGHRYDFQRPSTETYRGRHRDRVRQHGIGRQGAVEVRPPRAREENRAGDAQRPARRGSRRDGRGRALREDGRPRDAPFRPLQAEARHHQRYTVHFYRNVFGKVPRQKQTRVAKMLKAIHAQESREASEAKTSEVADSLESMKLFAAPRSCAKARRDALLHRLPHAALDQDRDEQRHRAAEQGDPPPNPRRRHVPRREIRADAGDRQAEIHSRKRVGPQALPRRIAARREGGQDVGR